MSLGVSMSIRGNEIMITGWKICLSPFNELLILFKQLHVGE